MKSEVNVIVAYEQMEYLFLQVILSLLFSFLSLSLSLATARSLPLLAYCGLAVSFLCRFLWFALIIYRTIQVVFASLSRAPRTLPRSYLFISTTRALHKE
jgi:hypothetical protein